MQTLVKSKGFLGAFFTETETVDGKKIDGKTVDGVDFEFADEDPIFKLLHDYRLDPRDNKIDLGIGVYRNDDNQSPVFAAVKAAEQWRIDNEADKAYIGPLGNLDFCQALVELIFSDNPLLLERLSYAQTPGGVGALRLAFELIHNANPKAILWVSDISWQVHRPIAHAVGLQTKNYPYFNAFNPNTINDDTFMPTRQPFELTLAALKQAKAGDAILLQASCHNPTGMDFTQQQWSELATLCRQQNVLPIIDMAYHGLGEGLKAECEGLLTLSRHVPELLLCYTCSKNFGLYRDRAAMLVVMSSDNTHRALIEKQLIQHATRHYFTPPAHGAALVLRILQHPPLKQQWLKELALIRVRLKTIREQLAMALNSSAINVTQRAWHCLTEGYGMFALLPLKPSEIETLKQDYGIYIVGNGRANLSGINSKNIEQFVAAISAVANTSETSAAEKKRNTTTVV